MAAEKEQREIAAKEYRDAKEKEELERIEEQKK
jgi:hypothetical protein